jgi:hypothetical protein
MDLNKLLIKTAGSHQPLKNAYEKTKAALTSMGTLPSQASSVVLTTESFESLGAGVDTLRDAGVQLSGLFRDIHNELSSIKTHGRDQKVQYTQESIDLRTALPFTALMMTADKQLGSLKSQTLQAPPAVANGVATINLEARDAGMYDRRSIYTPEAFMNYDLENSRIFSTLFNYSIVDFDDFTRTFWRPVTMSPDSSFVELLINVLTVFNGYEHNQDAKAKDWRRHNLVRAIADHTILHTNLTQAIPSKNSQNAEFFMTRVAEQDILQADRPITTAPLLMGVDNLDYIGLCMPDWLVKSGTLDQRDNLDPGVQLSKLYLALETDVIEFNVLNMPYTEFNAAPQGDRQKETLNWTTSALPVKATTKNVDGSDLVDLASVVTGQLSLEVRIDVFAEINLETGELSVSTGRAPSIRTLLDSDGVRIAPTDSRYTAIADKLKAAKEVGFTLRAFRSNADRRQRGQLINIRQFAENVVVPWRDPIAAERPAAGATDQDTADLTALMSATRIRIMNEGITALFDTEEVLAATVVDPEQYDSFSAPSTLGVGRHYVLPYYHHEELDMLKIVDSLKSSERNADIQAAIVSTLRNRLAHAYTDSQYKAASDALSGGTAPKPKVALVTDPVTARYIIEPGELRTMVDFELIVVPVLDYRMRGKIKMVFITDDGGTDVNYLNFGYLFWSPEHVLVANLMRTGAYNRETQVQPRYRHYCACPIMVSIDVTNIAEALKKITLNVEDQNPPAEPQPDPAP